MEASFQPSKSTELKSALLTTGIDCPFPAYPGSRKELTAGDLRAALNNLSPREIEQLGTNNYPDPVEWAFIRAYFVERDGRRRPLMQPDLTAYTPGETQKLLSHPEVKKWHRDIVKFKVPDEYDTIVFVPCAATKPWDTASRGIYQSYNLLRKERDEGKLPGVYFVTISEPLGVVPEAYWGTFPQYENPGLFSNSAQQSGMFTAEWKEQFGKKFHLPFDDETREEVLSSLGKVIRKFLINQGEKINCHSFVNDLSGAKSTHGLMLEKADPEGKLVPFKQRHLKRDAPRRPPAIHLRNTLKAD